MQPSTDAIVLRRTDYGEADRIVNFLTPELGKISVIAKGVRKPASKLAAGTEPLALAKITLRRGRGEMYTLTSAQMQTARSHIIEDYERLQLAYVVLKKINQAAETLHDMVLYELLRTSLESLDNKNISPAITETWFHERFLQVLGYGLNVSRDVNGKKLSETEAYRFSTEDMAFVPHQNGEFTADHLKVLKLLQLKTPEIIAKIGGVDRVINDCLRLLRGLDE